MPKSFRLGKRRITHVQNWLQRKTTRRKAIKVAFVASNAAILAIILAVVLQSPQSQGKAAQSLLLNTSATAANPLDEVSSTDIARANG